MFYMNFREKENFYNKDVVFEKPNAMKSLLHPVSPNCKKEPYRLAVFDMDRTTIDTSSPMLLVKKLLLEHRLSVADSAYIIKWAMSYKFHLPRQNNPVREKVFTAFMGKDALEVSADLQKFSEERIVPEVRKDAVDAMIKHLDDGIVVILLSASFDCVVARLMQEIPVNFGIATLMRITDDGKFTNEVLGTAPEAEGKPVALREFADAEFGAGEWVVEYAYGDHMSDAGILGMAKHPVAVCPDQQLKKYAKSQGWRIANW